MANVLHRILAKSQDNCYLSGISLTSQGPNILNLHFSDDTPLFLEAIDHNVANLN
jgi:hypothetical protein